VFAASFSMPPTLASKGTCYLDRPWEPGDFGRTRNLDTAKAIAEFATRHSVDAVLSPAHCMDEFPNPWLSIDLRLCEELRHELDRAGAKHVSIDFQIITTNVLVAP